MIVHITAGSHQHTVTPDRVDQALDELEANLAEPTLIRLAIDNNTMQLGLGHPSGAVVLFLDEHGGCWFSHGTGLGPDTSYRNGDTRHDFNSHATIPHHQARAAAIEFARTTRRPATIRWRQESS